MGAMAKQYGLDTHPVRVAFRRILACYKPRMRDMGGDRASIWSISIPRHELGIMYMYDVNPCRVETHNKKTRHLTQPIMATLAI